MKTRMARGTATQRLGRASWQREWLSQALSGNEGAAQCGGLVSRAEGGQGQTWWPLGPSDTTWAVVGWHGRL